MATEKTLNTRIKLRYDTYDAWHLANPTLLKGEVAIVELPTDPINKDHGVNPPAALIKVGPGSFNSLPFLSGLAADVHAWAKKSTVSYDGVKNKIVFSNGATDTSPISFDFDVVTPSELSTILAGYKAKTDKTFNETLTGAKVLSAIAQDADGDVTVTTRDLTYADIGAASAAQGEKADKAATALADITGTVKDYVDDAISGVVGGEVKIAETAKNYDTTDGTIKTKFEAVEKAITDEKTRAEGIEGGLRTDVDTIKGDYLKAADKEALQSQITANANAITAITDGVDPEKIDGLTDLIEWADTHAPEVASIKKDIEDEAARADAEEKRLAGLIGDNANAIAENAEDIKANADAITALGIVDGKVAKAVDSDKLGGTAAADYLKKSEATGYGDILTKTSADTLYQPVGNYQPAGAYALKTDIKDGQLNFSASGGLTTSGDTQFSANQADDSNFNISIADKGVTTDKIDDGAVTTDKIADKAVTTAKIADHAVGAAQIKAEQGYAGADAEVWVFDCGGAE